MIHRPHPENIIKNIALESSKNIWNRRAYYNEIYEIRRLFRKYKYSVKDECLYGKIIGITDAVIYEADSISELKKLFEKSVDDYLAFCREKGVVPEKSCKGSFNVRISPELHMRTVMFARDHDMTLNNVVMEAISSETRML